MSYESEVLADNPLLYLRLDEISGSECSNFGSIGQSGKGLATGAYTRNTANGGGSALGVGVALASGTGRIPISGNPGALNLTADATYECWVKSTVFTGYQTMMAKGQDPAFVPSGGGNFQFRIEQTSRTIALYKTGYLFLCASTTPFPNDGNWHHVAFTRAGDVYTIYLDGVAVGTNTVVATINSPPSIFQVGACVVSGNQIVHYLTGSIDEVAVYGTALSAARILAHYNARNDSSVTPVGSYQATVLLDSPKLFLRCNEGSGATLANAGSIPTQVATAFQNYTRGLGLPSGLAGLDVAISFNDATAYITYPDTGSDLSLTADVTYECWVKLDSFASIQYLMGKGFGGSGAGGYNFFIFTDRSIQVWAGSALYNPSVFYPNDTTNWHHLVFTRHGNIYRIYLDGVVIATSGTITTPNVFSNANRFMIGTTYNTAAGDNNYNSASAQLLGDVDEIAVYNKGLAPSQVLAHYNARDNTGVPVSTFVPKIMVY